MISIQNCRAERSNEVLRKCDELLARTAGWQHPLFEKKKAALERCKKQYADFREKIDQSEPGMCLIFSLNNMNYS